MIIIFILYITITISASFLTNDNIILTINGITDNANTNTVIVFRGDTSAYSNYTNNDTNIRVSKKQINIDINVNKNTNPNINIYTSINANTTTNTHKQKNKTHLKEIYSLFFLPPLNSHKTSNYERNDNLETQKASCTAMGEAAWRYPNLRLLR